MSNTVRRPREEKPLLAGLIPPIKFGIDIDPLTVICYVIVAVGTCTAGIFFAIALYVWTKETYGILVADLVLGIVFALIAGLAALTIAIFHRRRARLAAIAQIKAQIKDVPPKPEWWQDPAVISVGLEVVRTLGVRRVLTLAAIASVIGGALLYRPPRD